MVAVATTFDSCEGGLVFFFFFFFHLVELVNDGGRIFISKVFNGQKSSTWHKERLI